MRRPLTHYAIPVQIPVGRLRGRRVRFSASDSRRSHPHPDAASQWRDLVDVSAGREQGEAQYSPWPARHARRPPCPDFHPALRPGHPQTRIPRVRIHGSPGRFLALHVDCRCAHRWHARQPHGGRAPIAQRRPGRGSRSRFQTGALPFRHRAPSRTLHGKSQARRQRHRPLPAHPRARIRAPGRAAGSSGVADRRLPQRGRRRRRRGQAPQEPQRPSLCGRAR